MVADIAFAPVGDRLAALDRSGEIRVWPTAEGAEGPLHVFQGPEFSGMTRMIFGPKGRTLVQPGKGSDYLIWDLDAPPDGDPVMARRPPSTRSVEQIPFSNSLTAYSEHHTVISDGRASTLYFLYGYSMT